MTAGAGAARSVVEAFEEQVEARPDAIAVSQALTDGALTYRELDGWSRRIAGALTESAAVRTGDRVAICLSRSPALLASMLGVLRTGAAYVPVQAAEPERRRAGVLEDSDPVAVLVDTTTRSLFAAHPIVAVDPGDVRSSGPEFRGTGTGSRDLAALLFTSGSSGRPKAACVTHGNILNLVTEANYLPVRHTDRVLHHASVAFDASLFEVWGALVNGAQSVLSPTVHVGPHEFGRMLRDKDVTIVFLTAAQFHQQVDVDPAAFANVHSMMSGGEVLSPEHVDVLRAAVPGIQFVAGYGPTENTTLASCHRVGGDEDLSGGVPIGRPVQNVVLAVVDADGREITDGTPGELWVGGASVTAGYWNRPDLTAQKYVKPSWSGASGTYYRTGDRVRRRDDGVYEFLGRIDRQFKLRGFRIEPEEVERALISHPRVGKAAVELRTDHRGDKRIVAWLVCPDGMPARNELRAHLRDLVPDHMVPTALVDLERLPLTHNGKLDRRALPDPDWTSRALHV